MLERDGLIRTSGVVVRIAVVLNRIFLVCVGIGLLLSLLFWSALTRMLSEQHAGVDARPEMNGIRLMLLLGIVMAVANDRLLLALQQIIESTKAGDPFNAENARRLRTIGWALAALELLSVPAWGIERLFPSLGMGGEDPVFSVGGWMAVLMVFVLSRVFAAGAAMRDDLEGTV